MSRLDPSDLQLDVKRLFEPTASSAVTALGRVGVELELFPLDLRPADGPVPAACSGQELLDQLGTGALDNDQGGRFSFEPGGQIEYSTPAVSSIAALLADVRQSLDPVCAVAEGRGMRLAASGLTPWYGPDSVELHNPHQRYVEMDRYFSRIGPWGRWMMRHTASMQVNLDFGDPPTAVSRWRVANAVSPVLTAVFANSPADLADGSRLASGRAWVWSHLDESRTGIVGRPSGNTPPWAEYLTFALTARVMFDHEMRPVQPAGGVPDPAVRFNDWWIDGEDHGPVLEDWRTHLTTLFPDVRPKRWLEIRAIDVPTRAWWSVPPTLLAAMLYDEQALRESEELFSTLPDRPDEMSAVACRDGLADPRLRDLAAACFNICEAAVRRFPEGWFGSEALEALAGFRERYIESGLTQADEARAAGLVTTLSPGSCAQHGSPPLQTPS